MLFTHVSAKLPSLRTCFALICSCVLLASTAFAEREHVYNVNELMGDGSSGRVWRQWEQNVGNDRVSRVYVRLRKKSGGGDTYVNLRFKSGGTFENGKRVYLKDNGSHEFGWIVNDSPNGRPLLLNVYKGEVVVEQVRVIFSKGASSSSSHVKNTRPSHFPKPRRLPENYNEGRDLAVQGDGLQRCRGADRIRRPRIEIGEVRPSGGLFSGKYRINGEIFGACIEEAGYFERTRLKDEFEIPLTDRARRYPFSIQVRSGRRGEIRVYNIEGDEDTIEVDELIQDFNR